MDKTRGTTQKAVNIIVCLLAVVFIILAFCQVNFKTQIYPDNSGLTTTDKELNLAGYDWNKNQVQTRNGLVFFVGLDPTGVGFGVTNGEIANRTPISTWMPGANTMEYMIAVMSDSAVAGGDSTEYRYAWYSPSSRTLRYAYEGNGQTNIYNQLIVDTSVAKGSTGKLFYNQLKAGYDAATEGRGKWLRDNWRGLTAGKEAAAKQLWRAFAGTDGSQFNTNIRNYLGYTANMQTNMNDMTKWSDDEKELGYLAYLDLMMTVYSMTPADSDARTYYGNMIDRYISEGVVAGQTTQFNIAILPGFAMPLPQSAAGEPAMTVVTTTMDLWKYAYQITNSYDYGNKNISTATLGSGGTEINYYYDTKLPAMTVANVDAMVNTLGGEFPAANVGVRTYLEHCFSRRYDTTLKQWIAVGGAALNDKLLWPAFAPTGARDNIIGIDYFPAMPPVATAGTDGALSGDFNIEWSDQGTGYKQVSPNSSQINDSVRFEVQLSCLPEELPAWKNLTTTFTNFKIVLKPKRVYSSTIDATGDGSEVEKNLQPENYVPGTLEQSLSGEEFYSLITGSMIYRQLYDLGTVNQAIQMGQMIVYGYDLDVQLCWGRDATCSDGSTTISMSGTNGGFTYDEDNDGADKAKVGQHSVSAFRQEEHANSITYYTEPTAYAEIKQGTVEFDGTGTDETYEAMAGTPSTEFLYFASGGSEFILEFELNYMEGEQGVRWYQYKFYGTECEFKHQDQFKNIKAQGTVNGASKDALGTVTPNITIINETFVADENGIDYEDGGKVVEAQWYDGYIPEGAASYSVDLLGHDPCVGDNATGGANSMKESDGKYASDPINDNHMDDSQPITATWTGQIVNENPQQGSADANSDTTHIINHDKGNVAPPEHGGYVGNPGEFGETDTKWNIDEYYKAVNQALTWARAYEATNQTFTAMKWADSDNFQRIWKIGDAQIQVSFSGGISNMGAGNRPAGTYTTDNLESVKVDGTMSNWGYNLSFQQGTANTTGTCTPAAPPDTPHSDSDGSEETPSSVSNVGNITYTITVTFPKGSNGTNRLTAHELCGTCCRHNMQEVEDTFTQYSQYDYAYFSACRVYKIHRSYVDGMEEITFSDYNGEPNSDVANNHYMASGPIDPYTYFLSDKNTYAGEIGKVSDGVGAWYPHWQDGRKVISSYEQSKLHNGTDTIVAAITQGDPNIWYNIAMMHNATPYDSYANYAYEARNQWLEREGRAVDGGAKDLTDWPDGTGTMYSRMNVDAGRVAYTIMNSHGWDVRIYEASQRGSVSPGYVTLGGTNKDGVYGAYNADGSPFDFNGLISVWDDPIGSRSNKCDGVGMYTAQAAPAGDDTRYAQARTLATTNPVQIVANGHKKPTVTIKPSDNDYAGLIGNKANGGLTPNGETTDIPNWSVGILYCNANYTDDEFYMQTLTTPDDRWCSTVAIEGTVEVAGKYQDNSDGTVKSDYSSNTIDWYDYQSEEYQRFRYRRNQTNKIFVISDMLILQTSTGDQPVMYHWKSQTKRAQQHFDYTAANVDPQQAAVDSFTSTDTILKDNFDDMWYNQHVGRVTNTEDWYTATAEGWGVNNVGQYQQVNVGGYTGEYDDTENKYSETGLDIYTIDLDDVMNDAMETDNYTTFPLVTRRTNYFETILDRNGDLTDPNNVDPFTPLLLCATDGYGYGKLFPKFLDGKWNMDCYGCAEANDLGYVYGSDPDGATTCYTQSSFGVGRKGCWHWGSIVDSGARDPYKASYNMRFDAEYHSPGNANPGSGESRMSAVGGLRLVTDMIEQDPTNENGEYETGDAYQTYLNILDWPLKDDGELHDGLDREFAYVNGWSRETEMDKLLETGLARRMNQRFFDEEIDLIDSDHNENSNLKKEQGDGLILDANYSDEHNKVNDVIVHDPVSVQNALVLHNATADKNGWYSDTRTSEIDVFTKEGLDDKLDALEVCPGDDTCEFKVLNCKYFDDITFVSLDFEPANDDKTIVKNLAYDLDDGHQDEKTEYFNIGDFELVYQIHTQTELSDDMSTPDVDESKDENGNQAYYEEWIKPFGTSAGYFLNGPGDDFYGAKMQILLSDIGLSRDNLQNHKLEISFDLYQDTYLIEEPEGSGNFTPRPSTMFFGFNTFGFFTPETDVDPHYAFSSGNGLDKVTNVFDFYNNVNNVKIELDFSDPDAVLKGIHFYLNGKEVDSSLWEMNTAAPVTADSLFGNGSTFNIGCWNANDGYVARFAIDNLKIVRRTGSTEHTDACYEHEKVYETGSQYECLAPHVWETTRNYEGEVNGNYVGQARPYVFTVPADGKYRIQAWGAAGGGSNGGKGGYASGFVNLTKGEQLMIYPGGKGTQAPITGPDVEYLWGLSAGCGLLGNFESGAYGEVVPVSSVVAGPVEYKNSVSGKVENASQYGVWSKFDPAPGACGNHSLSMLFYNGKPITRITTGTVPSGTFSYEKNFTYSGGRQTWVCPQSGTYKLEVWGAQGGGDSKTQNASHGGAGGYSYGYKYFNKGETVYVYVGGKGQAASAVGQGGGYNGGGTGGPGGYGGGGMTHITTSSTDSLISSVKPGGNIPVTSGTKTYSNCPEMGWYCTDGQYHTVVFDPGQTGNITLNATHTYRIGYHRSGCTYGGNTYVKNGWGHLYDMTTGDCLSCNHPCGMNWSYGYWTLDLHAENINTRGDDGFFTQSAPEDNSTANFNTSAVLIVAGGGGGADNGGGIVGGNDDGSGGAGGGTNGGNALINGVQSPNTGGTQTSGFKRGVGQGVTTATDTGGAGGGWWGGKVTNNNNGGAGGGSGYLSSQLSSGETVAGANLGNGKAKITFYAGNFSDTWSGAGFNGGGIAMSDGTNMGYGGGGASDVRRITTGGGGKYVLDEGTANVTADGYQIVSYNGQQYLRIFEHNSATGGYFSSKTQARHVNTTGKYSILDEIDSYKSGRADKYQFMLYYPDSTGRTIWRQSKNPLNTQLSDTTNGNTKVEGYSFISGTQYNHFGGLALSTTSATLLDTDVSHSNWYGAIGATQKWPENGSGNTFPGLNRNGDTHVILYMAIDDETAERLTAGSATDDLGNSEMKENGSITYGPYITAAAGTWQVDIYGEGLSSCTFDVYSNDGGVLYDDDDLVAKKISDYHVEFFFTTSKAYQAGGNGLEVRVHHTNAPGYKFEALYLSRVNDRIIVAGGGGGQGNTSSGAGGNGGDTGTNGRAMVNGVRVNGSALSSALQGTINGLKDKYGRWNAIEGIAMSGCGLPGSSAGYGYGYGESASYPTGTGGAGGGWYGGYVTNASNGGAGGGTSGYNQACMIDTDFRAGQNTGNGKVIIELSEHAFSDGYSQSYGFLRTAATSTTPQTGANKVEGQVQEWTCPATGTYKLEVWGAAGGEAHSVNGSTMTTDKAGAGGYSSVVADIQAGTKLYIYVGGKGNDNTETAANTYGAGGWNGGGDSGTKNENNPESGGGGGGATHISLSANDTITDSHKNVNRDTILVMAGGGGGAHNYASTHTEGRGGAGGGLNGQSYNSYSVVGGQATGSGSGTSQGADGWSGGNNDPNNRDASAGNGGGWYGGAHTSGEPNSDRYGGAGGSGYQNLDLDRNGVSNVRAGENIGYGASMPAPAQTAAGSMTNYYVSSSNRVSGNRNSNKLTGGNGFARITRIETGHNAECEVVDITDKVNGLPVNIHKHTIACINSPLQGYYNNSITMSNLEEVWSGHLAEIDQAITEFIKGDDTSIRMMLGTSVFNKYRGQIAGYSGNAKGFIKILSEADLQNVPATSELFMCNNYPLNASDGSFTITDVLNCKEPHHTGGHYETVEQAAEATGLPVDQVESCYDPCLNDDNHKNHGQAAIVDATTVEGAFYINTDEYFDIYFPTVGDFYETNDHGIPHTQQQKGMGYVNDMDTKEWIRERYVKFDFDVLFYRTETGEWEQYNANEWIELPVKNGHDDFYTEDGEEFRTHYDGDQFELGDRLVRDEDGNQFLADGEDFYSFYCTLNNNEKGAAKVTFEAEAINAPGGEGKYLPRDKYPIKDNTVRLEYTDDQGNDGTNTFKTPSQSVSEKLFNMEDSQKWYNSHAIEGNNGCFVDAHEDEYHQGEVYWALYEFQRKGFWNSGYGQNNYSDDPMMTWGNIHNESEWKKLDEGATTRNKQFDASWTGNREGGVVVWEDNNGTEHHMYDGPSKKLLVREENRYNRVFGPNKDTDSDDNPATDHHNDNDNKTQTTNGRRQTSLSATHGAHKVQEVDLVGRIGNLIITNSSDVRWANFFKEPNDDSGNYLINGIVKEVYDNLQRNYFSWHLLGEGANEQLLAQDVRNRWVGRQDEDAPGYHWLYDTWKSQYWKSARDLENELEYAPANGSQHDDSKPASEVVKPKVLANGPLTTPLSPDKNNLEVYRNMELLQPGYVINYEITTTGNYTDRLRIKPYFYALSLNNENDYPKGTLVPIDVWMYTDGEYQPINLWGYEEIDEDGNQIFPSSGLQIYDYILALDWEKEKEQRMVTDREEDLTTLVHETIFETVLTGDPALGDEAYTMQNVSIPSGDYFELGNLQVQTVNNQARTFIGQSTTSYENFVFDRDIEESRDGLDLSETNFDNKFDLNDYAYRGQRWHLKLGLPSSAVFVPYSIGQAKRLEPTDEVNSVTKPKDQEWDNWDEAHPPVEDKDTIDTDTDDAHVPESDDTEKTLAMDVIANGDYAIVMTANIKALGPIWNLYYGQYSTLDGSITDAGEKRDIVGNLAGDNGQVEINGTTYRFDVDTFLDLTDGDHEDRSNSQTVLAVYANTTTSEADVDLIGTH